MFTQKRSLCSPCGGLSGVSVYLCRALLALLFGVFFAGSLRAAEEAGVSKEYKLKAALLYTFTKYVEWQPTQFSTPTSPLVIGIIGKNPFGEELAKAVKGRIVNGHSLVIRSVKKASEIPGVHLLFVGAGEEPVVVGDTMDLIQAPGILTVGETEQFTLLGGIITFVTVGDKVNFEVSRDSAERGKVKLTQELLRLSAHGRKKI